MKRNAGFGVGLTNERIVNPAPPSAPPEERSAADLQLIRERVAPPIVEQRYAVNLASGAIDRVDTSGSATNGLVVTVFTGTLDVWLDDGAVAGGFPMMRFTNVGMPVQVLLPLRKRRLSWLANGAATQAMVIVQGM